MNKEDISSLILTGFAEQNSKPGHCIDQRWLQRNIIDSLNPKQQQQIEPAIQDLVTNGLIVVHQNKGGFGWCMELTQDGYEDIYPIDTNEVIDEIGNAILTRFAEQKSKVGHLIDNRWLNHGLLPKFNPRKRELYLDAIEALENKKFIAVNQNGDGSIQSIVLQQEGFDHIY